MKKNDSIELKIEDMGVDGEGIGKYEGMTFFVKDAVIGDTICAGITKLKKNYGYARVQEILEPSPYRVQPECPLYARCGGCQIQAMDYRQQLCYKQKKVRGNLIRIGGFAPELIDSVMEEIVGMEQPYRYRNKAQFPIGADRDGMPVAGFYAARTHSIIPVEDCKLGVTQNEQILGTVLSTVLSAIGILFYAQSYGFLQLYTAPLKMSFLAVAAVLIGGATTRKASIGNVILGSLLFNGILATSTPVANALAPDSNLAEIVRIIVSNGIIVYALTKIRREV